MPGDIALAVLALGPGRGSGGLGKLGCAARAATAPLRDLSPQKVRFAVERLHTRKKCG
jgi:hypothetical protein